MASAGFHVCKTSQFKKKKTTTFICHFHSIAVQIYTRMDRVLAQSDLRRYWSWQRNVVFYLIAFDIIPVCLPIVSQRGTTRLQCKRAQMSRDVRKPDFLHLRKQKTQISFAVTAKLISAFVFATRIVQSLCFLNPKFEDSCHLLWLYSPVCVGPGQKPRRPVFWPGGSNGSCRLTILNSIGIMSFVSANTCVN